jgi:hypothetical protein
MIVAIVALLCAAPVRLASREFVLQYGHHVSR